MKNKKGEKIVQFEILKKFINCVDETVCFKKNCIKFKK